MPWGYAQLGRVPVAETYTVTENHNAGTGERTIQINGQVFSRHRSPLEDDAFVARRQEDVLGLADQIIPVTFTIKDDQNGYYQVKDVNVSALKWPDISNFNWDAILSKLGPDNAVDIESRLGTIVRSNNFALTGERWHAPSIGHYNYYVGASVPSSVTRTGADGAIVVYRSIPAGVNPRWGCPVASYMNGRVRILTSGYERNGIGIRSSATGWELNNGLVRVTPAGSTLDIAAYSGGAWQSKVFNIYTDTAALVVNFDAMSIIRNQPEMVTIRLTKDLAPGLAMLDLTLRRGSRIVEGYFQRSTAGELRVRLNAAEAFTDNSASGYVVASGNDAAGNRFAAGSAKTFLTETNGGVRKTATTTLDFWVGAVISGGAPASGDAATDLRNQYIGALSESTAVVKR